MTVEEAIRILDPETSREALKQYEEYEDRLEVVNEACRVACAAIREQKTKLDRSRWAGCDYCNGQEPHLNGDCVLRDCRERILCAPKDNPFMNFCVYERSIAFCPFCGRPLTEDAWDELERRINGGKTD